MSPSNMVSRCLLSNPAQETDLLFDSLPPAKYLRPDRGKPLLAAYATSNSEKQTLCQEAPHGYYTTSAVKRNGYAASDPCPHRHAGRSNTGGADRAPRTEPKHVQPAPYPEPRPFNRSSPSQGRPPMGISFDKPRRASRHVTHAVTHKHPGKTQEASSRPQSSPRPSPQACHSVRLRLPKTIEF